MANLLNRRYFVLTDICANSNKFWTISLYDNARVLTRFGRVGNDGQTDDKSFSCQYEAQKYFDKKVKDKAKVRTRRDSYTEINVIEGTEVKTTSVKSHHLSDIAVSQIKTNDESVKDLIRFLSDVNIHNITSSTQIKYNIDDGTFKTALGVVDENCIKTAAYLLEQISENIKNKGDEKDLIILCNKYLRQIPQDIGGSHVKIRVKDIFGTPDLIEKQNQIIQSLEAGLLTGLPKQQEHGTIFNAVLNLVTDQQVLDRIKQRVDHRKILNVYEVDIDQVKQQWNAYGSKLNNFQQLWHGTSPANVLSIIKSGFVIPKSFSNGWNHGPGVYFSDKLSKSWQYTPSNTRGNKRVRYVFLSDVALGNVYYGGGKSIQSQYNCLWYDKSGSNSQVVVYRSDQFNILYLVEFSD